MVDGQTDAAGWEYGMDFSDLETKRRGGRGYPRRYDYVKQQRWVKHEEARSDTKVHASAMGARQH